MRFSIITIVRNEENSLPRALKSVASQTFHNIEHIIVDGESTDKTIEIAKDYADKSDFPVKIINQRGEGGLYDAINQGIAEASGEIIAILHANDFYNTPEELSVIDGVFAANDTQIVYGNIRYFNFGNPNRVGRVYSASSFRKESLLDGFMPPHPAFFATKEIFRKYGCYPSDLKIAGDFEFMVKTLLKGKEKAVYINRIIVAMSTGGVSARLSNRLYHTIREKRIALKRNGFNVSPFRLLKRYLYLFK